MTLLANILLSVTNLAARLLDKRAIQYARKDGQWVARVEGYRATAADRKAAAQRVLWLAQAGALPNDF